MDELIAELRAALNAQTKPLLTPSEAAGLLSVSEEHLYEMRRDRRGPPFLQISPKVIRYDREALLAWARSYQIQPG